MKMKNNKYSMLKSMKIVKKIINKYFLSNMIKYPI